MRLRDSLWRDLQLVLHPEDVLAQSLWMGSSGAEERLELGGRDDLPQPSRRALEVISVWNHGSRVGQDIASPSER